MKTSSALAETSGASDLHGDAQTRAADSKTRAARCAPADTLTPADRYRDLFIAVQSNELFADSKTFVDCSPLRDPALILRDYLAQRAEPGFNLSQFVEDNFAQDLIPASTYVSIPGQPLAAHIDDLWGVLSRHPAEHPVNSSLLALPHPYVVPGGRFGEMYYWDSYFTMLGLAESGRHDLLGTMIDNFAYLIDRYGHIPNGTRTYYLSRSQPPVFVLMVELAEECGVRPALAYLDQLRDEHAYWMNGADGLAAGEARKRVVRLKNGAILNRYWDERQTPREESFSEDVATALGANRPVEDVYRDLRAAAESGWDFSSRWLEDGQTLASIRTTAILPVDLNSFLFRLESRLAQLSKADGNASDAERFQAMAKARVEAMQALMWNEEQGAFFDYDWQRSCRRTCLTAAAVVPLFVGWASQAQSERLAQTLAQRLLRHGGIATTECQTGEQWDRPNGWAPLQWLAVSGLSGYGHDQLAKEIACRWLSTVAAVYQHEGKLVEKYALLERPADTPKGGHGGEYPLQDGFGWTNGVTRRLLRDQPQHDAGTRRAQHRSAHNGVRKAPPRISKAR